MPTTAAAAAQPLKRPRPPSPSPSPHGRAPRRARATTAAAAATAPSQPLLPPYRLEYSASGPPSSAALASFLTAARRRGQIISGVHIANKDAGDRLLERGAALVAAFEAEAAAAAEAATPTTAAASASASASPAVEVCLHYSLKLQGGRGDEAVRRLSAFLERAARLGGCRGPRCSVLLVSGSGDPARRPKGQLCAAEALERLAAAGETKKTSSPPPPPLPPLYVAFNPYFPDPKEREAERARLRRKLATGLVTGGVALQFGADARLLDEGLAFLRRPDVLGGGKGGEAPATKTTATPTATTATATILGSVFLPTKRFLAQMRFRPWRGVFLKEAGFLESVEAAETCCAAVLRVYRARGVVPLVETALAVEEEEEEEEGKAGAAAKKTTAKAPGLAAAEALLRLGLGGGG